jgi:acyl-ACP thioesterase
MVDRFRTHWTEKHTVPYYQVDFKNNLRIDSIFNYLQEAASNNANSLGWGFKDLEKNNLSWVLSRAKLKIYRYISAGEEITVETWPKGMEGISAIRDFKIYDDKNNVLALATSSWLLVNYVTMRPVKNADFIESIKNSNIDNYHAITEPPGKILTPKKKEPIYERNIRYTDIDVNNHVNNVNCIRFVLDCFEMNDGVHNNITSFQINFLSELKYGDIVQLFRGNSIENDHKVYIEGVKNNNQLAFQSEISME